MTEILPDAPIAWHPGRLVWFGLKIMKMKQKELAQLTGYSPKHISQIIRGHAAITNEAAARFEEVLRIPAIKFAQMQASYDFDLKRGAVDALEYLNHFMNQRELSDGGDFDDGDDD